PTVGESAILPGSLAPHARDKGCHAAPHHPLGARSPLPDRARRAVLHGTQVSSARGRDGPLPGRRARTLAQRPAAPSPRTPQPHRGLVPGAVVANLTPGPSPSP